MLEVQERPIRALSPDEQRRVVQAAARFGLRWHTFCYLAITTGMRRSELCGLTWDAIDFDAHRLCVTKSKAKRLHVVRLTDQAVQLLRRLRLTHALPMVFVSDNGQSLYWAVGRMMDKITAEAGVPRFTCHDTRRTFCTDLARAGVNQKVASQLVGHASPMTTAKFYQAVDDEMADAALATLPLARTRTA